MIINPSLKLNISLYDTTMRYAHAITEQSLSAIETLSNYAERNNKVVAIKVI